jgi:hypothetical protein
MVALLTMVALPAESVVDEEHSEIICDRGPSAIDDDSGAIERDIV